MRYRVVSNGKTGDCGPEQVYGQDEPPVYDTLQEAEAAADELQAGDCKVMPDVEYWVEEVDSPTVVNPQIRTPDTQE